ncbi:MAG: hypothetical protein LBD42_03440 [Desulfovibrio sp.]|jgi:hypothetical protein|nr:hypothetical protein [Desulfovibrio sp.]
MASEFDEALSRIAQVVMFENWLRFYFISEEEGGKLLIRLPEKAMKKLRTCYAAFYGLAESLNNREIDHQTSINEVCLFVAAEIDGKGVSEQLIGQVFDSVEFQTELQLFSAWVQAHEEKLEDAFMEFTDWLARYAVWKQDEKVEAYRKHLLSHMAGMDQEASTASH